MSFLLNCNYIVLNYNYVCVCPSVYVCHKVSTFAVILSKMVCQTFHFDDDTVAFSNFHVSRGQIGIIPDRRQRWAHIQRAIASRISLALMTKRYQIVYSWKKYFRDGKVFPLSILFHILFLRRLYVKLSPTLRPLQCRHSDFAKLPMLLLLWYLPDQMQNVMMLAKSFAARQ